MPKCIVITGSIGCGKSSVCSVLKEMGYEIVDADAISKTVSKTKTAQIEDAFGEEYIENGQINTKKLGKLVFENKEAKKKLEAIMHPEIKKEIFKKIDELEKKDKIYFVDIPLFFESENYRELSPVAVVYAPRTVQLERIMRRDGLGEIDANNRIESQIDIEKKAKMADFVIDNSGSKEELQNNIEIFLKEAKQWFCKNTAQAETIF